VACGAVNDVGGALVEPQTAARGLLVHNDHPAYGEYEHVRGPLPTQGRESIPPAPLLGEHTTAVLDALGYPPSRVASLRDAGIVS
jgi:crotonobetainyl-CoA:carnitine CoA-transferase CaiB-like acyl-CoA transferase